MKPFVLCETHAAPLVRDNIDTDLIVRIERIAQLRRGQFQPWAFETWRYLPDGSENPDFVLNQEPYRQTQIIMSGANFGCGSSREMAVWALEEFGIRCIVAESYGDIFFNNCLQNGLLPVTLDRETIHSLVQASLSGDKMSVDLRQCTITTAATGSIAFVVPEMQRQALLQGQDDIAQTLAMQDQIDAFQQRDRQSRPWVY
ncbi:3-isopropylmalate dehydratase small subunit [Pollutimonas harenae]|uniref:3-isopropylmalate dehydratase n=1 Tax=Pollutimonas harenae TaxID=657015 RepID=A0A853GTF8_9BURK|nr:3-isopropylmalate dehydratase small subunit [Pollutimonas harenae]NYT84066.1 3-isopropylmalate dehydratase small subunit [Pollutimonas harenae]TEA73509.1 3-isopropylmalate dehydratase small subunit [Pollutimonas harenae]